MISSSIFVYSIFSSEIKFAYNEMHQYWDYMDFDKYKPFEAQIPIKILNLAIT